jgi:hypothetical protein
LRRSIEIATQSGRLAFGYIPVADIFQAGLILLSPRCIGKYPYIFCMPAAGMVRLSRYKNKEGW